MKRLKKEKKKSKIFGIFFDEHLENLDDHGCRENRDLTDGKKMICSSYPFKNRTTLHSAKRKT